MNIFLKSQTTLLLTGLLFFAFAAPSPAMADTGGLKEAQSLPSLAPLVDAVKAAVVNVEVVSRAGGMGEGDEEGMPEQMMPNPFGFGMGIPRREPQVREGLGSGFVIDPKGYILTNNHVVDGATSIRVRFGDGRSFEGEVMGRDPLTDVALLKIRGNASNLPTLKLGDSDAMRVGDWVVAIGAPYGLAASVSAGIISARAREIHAGPYDDFLQTDAAINPGNSGGPLFNLRGEVIGINTAILAGGATGIGFAVPSNLAKALVPQLEKSGKVVRGYMGVGTQKLTPEIAKALGIPVREGALVFSVESGTPAQRAGLSRDDVIVSVDGTKIESDATLRRVVALKSPGSVVNLGLYRAGKAKPDVVKVTLATKPVEGGRRIPGVSGRNEVNPDEEPNRHVIGLKLQTLEVDPTLAKQNGLPTEGVLISDVTPGSSAERAELFPGMVVIEAGRQPVHSAAELSHIIKAAKPGSNILLRVQYKGSLGVQVRVLEKPN